jgi:hypothetical protein
MINGVRSEIGDICAENVGASANLLETIICESRVRQIVSKPSYRPLPSHSKRERVYDGVINDVGIDPATADCRPLHRNGRGQLEFHSWRNRVCSSPSELVKYFVNLQTCKPTKFLADDVFKGNVWSIDQLLRNSNHRKGVYAGW